MNGGILTDECVIHELNKVLKCILNYYWHGDTLIFMKGFIVLKLGE
jgi:hypothetical protein